MARTLTTQNDIASTPGSCFAYYGDCGDWGIACTKTRDSEILSQSNFAVMLARLESVDAQNVTTESASHWVCGWVERILVAPGSVAWATACALLDQLDDYAVLDEDDYSARESEACYDYVAGEVRAAFPELAPIHDDLIYDILDVKESNFSDDLNVERADPALAVLRWARGHKRAFRAFVARRRTAQAAINGGLWADWALAKLPSVAEVLAIQESGQIALPAA